MLILRTGTPGAGKTLNTIKDIDEEYGADPKKPDKELRTIYYYNIPELDNDKLKANWVQFDDPENWYKYPDGSLFVIDEAQEVFPNDGKKDRPDKISKMERHRHHGHDIVLITQHPTLISPHVRKLVGKHIHLHRRFGGNSLLKYVYEFCVDEPQRKANYSLAQLFHIKLDKKYYGVYKSATEHTHKFKMPKQYITLMIASVAIVVCGVLAFFTLKNMAPQASVPESAVSSASDMTKPKNELSKVLDGDLGRKEVKTKQQYITEHVPRLKDYPASAPRYDELNKPVVMPKPNCYMSNDTRSLERARKEKWPMGYSKKDKSFYLCRCYTQQASVMNVSFEACYSYVQNGYFDDTLAPSLQPTAPQSATEPSARIASGSLNPNRMLY